MSADQVTPATRGRFNAISLALFVASVAVMGYMRLVVFPHSFITLSYGLPLLLCLWHADRRLLWGMTLAFIVMSAYKALFLMDASDATEFERAIHWVMQVINILVIAYAVSVINGLMAGLRSRNARIEAQNAELRAREEEIQRQNEELTAQSEELAQQNEEIQQQNEEMHQQAEELQAQSEDLQVAYTEAERREAVLQLLVDSLEKDGGPGVLPIDFCEPLLALFHGKASGAIVAERVGDRFAVLSHVGMEEYADGERLVEHSFGGLVMREGRTAFIEDLRSRPDIDVKKAGPRTYRSVLATPLRVRGEIVGVVEVVSTLPQQWTKEEFKILEWVSAQCTLVMETRRLREELQRSNVRLDAEVRDRTARLQDSVNELEHFSYTITHDLRAPLRAMQGFASLLGEKVNGNLDSEGKDFLSRIMTAAARMDRLITDALSYSRIVREELPLAPVDLRELLEGMLASYPAFQPPAARIEVAQDLPQVMANEAGLTQLFSNLLGNAVKFVPKDRVPEVRIHGERTNGTVRICVADNGIGIDPSMHDRVFVMFQRLSKDYEGTGIGLALVRKIAERMGGSVSVESEPGEGCRFWVELRAAEAPVVQ
jgi:signal transduction histidine kinase